MTNLKYCLVFLFLTGCGIDGLNGKLHDRTNDYLKAKPAQPLKTPSDFEKRTVPQSYGIPEGEVAKEPVSVLPPGVL